jgi:thiamine-monophosphate kinase
MTAPPDEFAWIERLKPLTRSDPRALGLLDDAAVIPGKPGFELVISKDAMVEGVHFLRGEAPGVVARRLLRTNLSDLAAKAAEPFGYFLATAWPDDRTWADRDAFIGGLDQDGAAFGVVLLGGDTVRAVDGALTLSATVLGWAPEGRTIRRSGARAGDVLVVCGVIGDGWLGLKAALGKVEDPGGAMAAHYRTPTPLLLLREALRRHAHAAADVSDGLIADAGHLARASGLGLALELENLPLSPGAFAWRGAQPDPAGSSLALATGGDDYAIVCAVAQSDVGALLAEARVLGVAAARIGAFRAGDNIDVTYGGERLAVERPGWRH